MPLLKVTEDQGSETTTPICSETTESTPKYSTTRTRERLLAHSSSTHGEDRMKIALICCVLVVACALLIVACWLPYPIGMAVYRHWWVDFTVPSAFWVWVTGFCVMMFVLIPVGGFIATCVCLCGAGCTFGCLSLFTSKREAFFE